MKKIEEAYNKLIYSLEEIGEHKIVERLETQKKDFITNEEPLDLLQSIFPRLSQEDIRTLPAFRNILKFIVIRNLLNRVEQKFIGNVFVAHSKTFNYRDELYNPLKNSLLSKRMNFIFPYDENANYSENILPEYKYMIVEVSAPSIRLGMEIERARSNGIEIICIFKRGYNPELCLKEISKTLIQYDDTDDMLNKLDEYFILAC